MSWRRSELLDAIGMYIRSLTHVLLTSAALAGSYEECTARAAVLQRCFGAVMRRRSAARAQHCRRFFAFASRAPSSFSFNHLLPVSTLVLPLATRKHPNARAVKNPPPSAFALPSAAQ